MPVIYVSLSQCLCVTESVSFYLKFLLFPNSRLFSSYVWSTWASCWETEDSNRQEGDSSSLLNLTLFKGDVVVWTTRAICSVHPLPSDRHGSELFKSWEWFGWISADYEFLVCGRQLLVMNQSATQGDFWSKAHFCIMRSEAVQINGVSILMWPRNMAGWWILFAQRSPVLCLPALDQGETKEATERSLQLSLTDIGTSVS